jgi:hypothetical protein
LTVTISWPLDDPNAFRYRGQPSVKRADGLTPYLSVSVQFYRFQGVEPKLKGQFTLTLQPLGNPTTFILGRVGATPLLSFPLTRQLT